jgi:kynurenine formamidase
MKIVPSIRVFPGYPQPSFITWYELEVHGYSSKALFLSTNTGTHIDAPLTFHTSSKTIDRLDVSRFVSRAVLLKTSKMANQLIMRSDIANCDKCKRHGNLCNRLGKLVQEG